MSGNSSSNPGLGPSSGNSGLRRYVTIYYGETKGNFYQDFFGSAFQTGHDRKN
jgi:hypothetical protein